jgi:hypothetical protein
MPVTATTWCRRRWVPGRWWPLLDHRRKGRTKRVAEVLSEFEDPATERLPPVALVPGPPRRR